MLDQAWLVFEIGPPKLLPDLASNYYPPTSAS
jgi:hypothetical protein